MTDAKLCKLGWNIFHIAFLKHFPATRNIPPKNICSLLRTASSGSTAVFPQLNSKPMLDKLTRRKRMACDVCWLSCDCFLRHATFLAASLSELQQRLPTDGVVTENYSCVMNYQCHENSSVAEVAEESLNVPPLLSSQRLGVSVCPCPLAKTTVLVDIIENAGDAA